MTAAPTTPSGGGNLRVESLLVEGEAVLRLSGELDMHSADLFAEAARLVPAHGIPTLVLDLSELSFIDSTGLRELVVAFTAQREIGGDLVLRAPSEHVRRVIDIVGLTDMLTMADSVTSPPHAGPEPSRAIENEERSSDHELRPGERDPQHSHASMSPSLTRKVEDQ